MKTFRQVLDGERILGLDKHEAVAAGARLEAILTLAGRASPEERRPPHAS